MLKISTKKLLLKPLRTDEGATEVARDFPVLRTFLCRYY